MKKPLNGIFPAFAANFGKGRCSMGLTKREYFAGLAMQGILANGSTSTAPKVAAIYALECADELLQKLEEEVKA